MKNIVFFNHWHYGDLFSTRGLVTDIQRQLLDFRYGYVHHNSPLSTRDLITINLTPEKSKQILASIDHRTRFAQSEDTIFINTWVGAYQGMWEGHHPPYTDHFKIFKLMYDMLNQHFNLNLEKAESDWQYIPEIDYSKIDVTKVEKFLSDNGRPMHLICNNEVKSEQSDMGFMENIVDILARNHPSDIFVATHKFDTSLENIRFTYDIFQMDNDLLEISYLSKFARVIVGKNSSPYTYTQTRANLLDSNKKLVCFSRIESDTLPYGFDCPARCYFSNTIDDIEAAYIINNLIKESK